jgi:sec-independent protein translocase protein TatA
MFRQFGAQELLIILLIVVLLFGAKKLPETARGLGRSLRIFKAETKGLTDDDATDQPSTATTPPQITAQGPAPASETVEPTAAPAPSNVDERS